MQNASLQTIEDKAAPITVEDLHGFDPLSEGTQGRPIDKSLFEAATQRVVLNILKSYTGYFDLFAELLQKALDAIDKKAAIIGDDYKPQIWINIDIGNRYVAITDNGCGMSPEEVRFCFRPNVSFKTRKKSRGHKGVGATFLAYGFGMISVHTKTEEDFSFGVKLTGGRRWAEDQTGAYPRPKLELDSVSLPALRKEDSGTSVKVSIDDNQRPDLGWWNATTAKQWYDILRMRTPLGGVYLSGNKAPKIKVSVEVTDFVGVTTKMESNFVEYFYPHEMTEVLPKVKSLSEIKDALSDLGGDQNRIPQEFKMIDAMYDIWRSEDILDDASQFGRLRLENSLEELIRKHDVSVYGCFFSSAKKWTDYQQEVLKIRKTPLIFKGGFIIASDYMVQGDLNVIPLTSTIGYQANTHVIVHFHDGNPDMGRKVFQPEFRTLAEDLSRQIVNIFKKYLYLMREDTGASNVLDDTDNFNWLGEKQAYRASHPLEFSYNDCKLAYAAVPRAEQDVISLFHELVGMQLVRGIRFLCTSELDQYDSCYITCYDSEHIYTKQNQLGVSSRIANGKESRPFPLEYKFDLDGLIADFASEKKYQDHIKAIVCWQIGNNYSENFSLRSYLVGEEGSGRQFYGATHALYHERIRIADIICLKDLLSFSNGPESVCAEHQTRFKR